MEFKQAWAYLKLWNQNDSIQLSKYKYTFGRDKTCDFSFPDNKLLSNHHCHIEKDTDTNLQGLPKVWLVDNSTNGCFINSTKHIHKTKYLLLDGDVIAISLKQNDPQKNITFKFEYTGSKRETDYHQNDPVGKKLKSHQDRDKTDPEKRQEIKECKGISDIITCTICFEIIHDCISLQPCLHSFCNGCYSEWMTTDNGTCPICRVAPTCVSKNHTINSLIEKYLEANPNQARSKETIKELDEKNKISNDVFYRNKCAEPQSNVQFRPTLYVVNMAAVNQCRQCPGQPSNSNDINRDDFQCDESQDHMMCLCCFEYMPDRSSEPDQKQTCSKCSRAYCSLYWECKHSCLKCLVKFSDIKITGDGWKKNLINDNEYESEVFGEYLSMNCIEIQDLFEELIEQCREVEDFETTEAIVCRDCGFKILQKLAYEYRENVSDERFFDARNNKPNCWWGKECRTQKHNLDHAREYNHICEKKRRMI